MHLKYNPNTSPWFEISLLIYLFNVITLLRIDHYATIILTFFLFLSIRNMPTSISLRALHLLKHLLNTFHRSSPQLLPPQGSHHHNTIQIAHCTLLSHFWSHHPALFSLLHYFLICPIYLFTGYCLSVFHH